eukprot:SAG31_NODE_11512_length_1022_cov_1.239437_1_plen_101_part_00
MVSANGSGSGSTGFSEDDYVQGYGYAGFATPADWGRIPLTHNGYSVVEYGMAHANWVTDMNAYSTDAAGMAGNSTATAMIKECTPILPKLAAVRMHAKPS